MASSLLWILFILSRATDQCPRDPLYTAAALVSQGSGATIPRGRSRVKDTGSIVVCSVASEGAGFHSLIGPGCKIESSGGFPASMFAPRQVAIFDRGHRMEPDARMRRTVPYDERGGVLSTCTGGPGEWLSLRRATSTSSLKTERYLGSTVRR